MRILSLVWMASLWMAPVLPAFAQEVDTSAVRRVDFQAESCSTEDGGRTYLCLDVSLTEDETVLTADRGIQEGNEIYLFLDNVRVVSGSDTLTTDRLRYDGNTKTGRATGRVRLGDGDVEVVAPDGDYNTETKRADFRSGVTLVDSVSTLTAMTGSYWTESRHAEFAGDVLLVQDSLLMAADSLFYDREQRESRARTNVVVAWREDNSGSTTWVLGDRATNREESGLATVFGDVLMLQVSMDSTGAGTDSLWIRSESVDVQRTDSVRTVTAVDSVRIAGDDLAALADSVTYTIERIGPGSDRRVSRLFGHPVAWFGDSQVTGDTLSLTGRGGRLDTLLVVGRAFVALRDSADAPVQQLSGRRMRGLFERDSLRVLTVLSNARALYHLPPDDDREPGAIVTSGDEITLHLDRGEVEDIRIYRGIEGTYYPASRVSDALNLDGFTWMPDRRPDAGPMRTRYLTAVCRLEPERCARAPESR